VVAGRRGGYAGDRRPFSAAGHHRRGRQTIAARSLGGDPRAGRLRGNHPLQSPPPTASPPKPDPVAPVGGRSACLIVIFLWFRPQGVLPGAQGGVIRAATLGPAPPSGRISPVPWREPKRPARTPPVPARGPVAPRRPARRRESPAVNPPPPRPAAPALDAAAGSASRPVAGGRRGRAGRPPTWVREFGGLPGRGKASPSPSGRGTLNRPSSAPTEARAKSTLLAMLAGKPFPVSAGEIRYQGARTVGPACRPSQRARLGLIPHVPARQRVQAAHRHGEPAGRRSRATAATRFRGAPWAGPKVLARRRGTRRSPGANHLARAVSASKAHAKQLTPGDLSGGQRRMVEINGGALMAEPKGAAARRRPMALGCTRNTLARRIGGPSWSRLYHRGTDRASWSEHEPGHHGTSSFLWTPVVAHGPKVPSLGSGHHCPSLRQRSDGRWRLTLSAERKLPRPCPLRAHRRDRGLRGGEPGQSGNITVPGPIPGEVVFPRGGETARGSPPSSRAWSAWCASQARGTCRHRRRRHVPQASPPEEGRQGAGVGYVPQIDDVRFGAAEPCGEKPGDGRLPACRPGTSRARDRRR